jgi:hypothetical protein
LSQIGTAEDPKQNRYRDSQATDREKDFFEGTLSDVNHAWLALPGGTLQRPLDEYLEMQFAMQAQAAESAVASL